MLGSSTGRMIGAVVVARSRGSALAFHFRGGGCDAWGRFIYDYQTLLTGIGAIGAASVTILVMRVTEDKQGRRHLQLVELALRPDRLKSDRVLIYVHRVRTWSLRIGDGKREIAAFEMPRYNRERYDKWQYGRMLVLLLAYRDILGQLNDMESSTIWRHAEPLFHGQLCDDVFRMQRHLRKSSEAVTKCVLLVELLLSDEFDYDPDIKVRDARHARFGETEGARQQMWKSLMKGMDVIMTDLDRVAVGLEHLRTIYVPASMRGSRSL